MRVVSRIRGLAERYGSRGRGPYFWHRLPSSFDRLLGLESEALLQRYGQSQPTVVGCERPIVQ